MFKLGDHWVICDQCGMQRYASECQYTWDGLFVCGPCWSPRHPQDFVRAIPDNQTVDISRPGVVQVQGQTTVGTAAVRYALSIVLTSVSWISNGDSIGITLDDGTVHWTYSNGAPSGTTVTLGSEMPGPAAAGNVVYLPSVSNEKITTATMLTATGL